MEPRAYTPEEAAAMETERKIRRAFRGAARVTGFELAAYAGAFVTGFALAVSLFG